MEPVIDVSVFRADFYLTARIPSFDLDRDSRTVFDTLKKVPQLDNLATTKVTKREEKMGRMEIDEWYEISGSLKIPEGFKSFWVVCKRETPKEPFNIFMRIDRNAGAESYEEAQGKTRKWVEEQLGGPLRRALKVEELQVKSPSELSSVRGKVKAQ